MSLQETQKVMSETVTKIVYWWSRPDRAWVTTARDAEGNQVGDAEYSGTRDGLDWDLKMMDRKYPNTPVEKLKPVSL